jgi:uncharacterized protein YndB with AHSA1/START domain
MPAAVQNTIEREVTFPYPIERVWATLTEPAAMSQWFCSLGVEIDLRPGGLARFLFRDGSYRAIIHAVNPPTYFAWRWAPGTLEDRDRPLEEQEPLTLVEFFLNPVGTSTRLRLVESGFGALAEEQRMAALRDNDQGWDECLVEFAAALADDGRQG